MTKTIVVVSLLLWTVGCASRPPGRVSRPQLDGVAPARVRADFERRMPDRFETLESVVIDYGARSFAMLGYIEVDLKAEKIAFAAFTPSGVRIAEARSSGQEVHHSFASGETLQQFDREELVRGIIEAIQRVYFNRIPRETAEVGGTEDGLVFSESFGEGRIEFIFGGPRNALIEKTYRESGKEVWRVSYADYVGKSSWLYPGRIVLDDHRHEFRLTIRLKTILS